MSYNVGRQPFYARESFAGSFSNYDVIDPRIDVAAQKALITMKGNPSTSAAAASILAEVKGGRLAGIYGDDLRAAAQLAARIGTVRWKLVPSGRDSALIQTASVPPAAPTIIFRSLIRSEPKRLIAAVLNTWRRSRVWAGDPVLMRDGRTGRYEWVSRRAGASARPTALSPAEIALPFRRLFQTVGTLTKLTSVGNTSLVPYRYVCRLVLTFEDTTLRPIRVITAVGTGTLISPIHVLTAAHCLMTQVGPSDPLGLSRSTPASAVSAAIFPGQNGILTPFSRGVAGGSAGSFRVSPEWARNGDKDLDFGLITLNAPLANSPGFWGQRSSGTRIAPLDDKQFSGAKLFTAGYPSRLCPPDNLLGKDGRGRPKVCTPGSPEVGTGQWEGNGVVLRTTPFLAQYDIETNGGQSGSPLWVREKKDVNNLVCIHARFIQEGGQPTSPSGVRLTRGVLDVLRNWMKEDKVKATF
jgi:V8-like Glu-specific endopeptidase